MIDNVVLDWIIVVLIIAFGGYELYRGIKQYLEHRKEKMAYVDNHKHYEYFEEYRKWFGIYLAATLVSVVLGIYYMVTTDDFVYAIGFLVLAACAFGFALDTLVKRRAWFYEEGFFYEKRYYRYRSVASVKRTPKWVASYDVAFNNAPSMVMTKKMGDKLQEKMKEHKKNKKGDRK